MDEQQAGPGAPAPDAAAAAQRHPRGYGVLGAAITGFLALFYAYSVWEALNSLLAFNGLFEAIELAMPPSMWIVLLAVVVLPLVVFLLALRIGWRQPNWARALVLVTGLALCQALSLAMMSLVVDVPAF